MIKIVYSFAMLNYKNLKKIKKLKEIKTFALFLNTPILKANNYCL